MAKEYSAAKWYWLGIITLQVVLLVASVASLAIQSRAALLLLGGLVFAIPLTTLALKELAGTRYAQGERLRRLYVLQDALGQEPDRIEVLLAAADETILPKSGPEPIGSYFNSGLKPGYQRLAHVVQESTFYTRRIAKASATGCGILALAGIMVAIGVLWWGAQQTIPSVTAASGTWIRGERAARVFTEVFGFFAAGVFAELALSFRSLAKTAENVFEKCAGLLHQTEVAPTDVFWQVGNYDGALAKAPPLPDFVKRIYAQRLARSWASYENQAGT